MTDQTTPNATDEERMRARAWAERARDSLVQDGTTLAIAHVVLDAVPAPSPPTLADMTLDEQDECTGMQADLAQGGRVVILDGTPDAAGLVQVLEKSLDVYRAYPAEVTPRPDLPRMEWPGDQKPAPALPDGWRLADHPKRGRVIVTNPTPHRDGRVYFVLPDANPLGHDWFWCDPDELTYIDQEADQ